MPSAEGMLNAVEISSAPAAAITGPAPRASLSAAATMRLEGMRSPAARAAYARAPSAATIMGDRPEDSPHVEARALAAATPVGAATPAAGAMVAAAIINRGFMMFLDFGNLQMKRLPMPRTTLSIELVMGLIGSK